MTETAPIACTLAPRDFKDRLASINTLARDALRGHKREGLVLELRYAPEARDRVREMVCNEQTCCAFLDFQLRESPAEIQLTIVAPEAARESAEMMFEQLVAGASTSSVCGCPTPAAHAQDR
jgi:hypothetical protein